MSLGRVLGLISIVLGFVSAFVKGDFLFDSLVWFVLSIAFVVVLDVAVPFLSIGRSHE